MGHFYQVMVRDVKQLLAHVRLSQCNVEAVQGVLAKMFPALLGLQPKLSGFGWFQGWNDGVALAMETDHRVAGCDLNQTAAYENNMVNLIKDLRNEWQSPALPVAIAVAGFDGFDGGAATRTPRSDTPWIDMTPADKLHTECTNDRGCRRLDVILSQFAGAYTSVVFDVYAAANKTRHPEIGPVVAIETRGFWRDAQYSPNRAQGYHYWHNAETYYLVGQAMATGMASLL